MARQHNISLHPAITDPERAVLSGTVDILSLHSAVRFCAIVSIGGSRTQWRRGDGAPTVVKSLSRSRLLS
jgi:hypothetical protein